MGFEHDFAAGVHNLLENCADLRRGESVLIVCEDPGLGWYDAAAPDAVAHAAEKRGAVVTRHAVGGPTNDRDHVLEAAVGAHDCTIYFSRIGDQDRFAKPVAGKKSVMCYVRDAEMLASPFCTTSHLAFKDLKQAIDAVTLAAGHIEISCPLGTRFSGTTSAKARLEKTDVSVHRFPLCVPLPLEAAGFSGRVALSHFLTPTGSKTYKPSDLPLADITFADVEHGRITRFSGNAGEIARIEKHYDLVAGQLGIDREAVHSWHAGIHPGCAYKPLAADDPDRWSNTAFGNPRIVHFHTCGNYAPGEICWMVFDHTITLDGTNLWDDGRLEPGNFPETAACVDKWPELGPLFEHPAREIGLPQ